MSNEKRKASYQKRKKRHCKKAPSLTACRKAVFYGDDPNAKAGRLKQGDLILNRRGKVVSKRKSEASSARYESGNALQRRNDFIRREAEAGRFDDGGYHHEEYPDEEEGEDDWEAGGVYDVPPSQPTPRRMSNRRSKGRNSKFDDYQVYGLKKGSKQRSARRRRRR